MLACKAWKKSAALPHGYFATESAADMPDLRLGDLKWEKGAHYRPENSLPIFFPDLSGLLQAHMLTSKTQGLQFWLLLNAAARDTHRVVCKLVVLWPPGKVVNVPHALSDVVVEHTHVCPLPLVRQQLQNLCAGSKKQRNKRNRNHLETGPIL